MAARTLRAPSQEEGEQAPPAFPRPSSQIELLDAMEEADRALTQPNKTDVYCGGSMTWGSIRLELLCGLTPMIATSWAEFDAELRDALREECLPRRLSRDANYRTLFASSGSLPSSGFAVQQSVGFEHVLGGKLTLTLTLTLTLSTSSEASGSGAYSSPRPDPHPFTLTFTLTFTLLLTIILTLTQPYP